jgi:hypothetical protein
MGIEGGALALFPETFENLSCEGDPLGKGNARDWCGVRPDFVIVYFQRPIRLAMHASRF